MRRVSSTTFLLIAVVVVPLLFIVVIPRLPPLRADSESPDWVQLRFPDSILPFTRIVPGSPPHGQPLITNVKIADLDRDGLPDVLVADAVRHRVIWYRQQAGGAWQENVLGDVDLPTPCHISVVDFNGDGSLDLVVAVLGSAYPTDEPIGQVVWLQNNGRQQFTTQVVLDDLRRVSDVQVGDLNGDGRLDMTVAEFGYDRGRVLWLENKGNGRFRDHELFALSGAIHVPIVDLNGDGRLDIVTVFSQEDEEVMAFENLGDGQFRRRTLASHANFDLGSSGLFVNDLNGDGHPDLLLTAGDNLEITHNAPQPWHGCYLLENKGDWHFERRKLANVPGVYSAGVGDLNGDGHPDVVLVSMFNNWRQPQSASVVWLENDGHGQFTPWQIASTPSHLATVAVGDLNQDGRADIVAGSLHVLGPFDRLGRVTMWLSGGIRP